MTMMEDEELLTSDDDMEAGDMFPDDSLKRISIKRHAEVLEESSENENLLSKSKSGAKKRKLKKENNSKQLHKPPTVEELNRLRETENLFHSNLFRRQIDEMLNEVLLKSKLKVRIKTWIDKLKDCLLKMEESYQAKLLESADWFKMSEIKLPLHQFLKPVKGNFYFKKPVTVRLAGSYLTNTAIGLGNVDVMVEIPKSFFEKDDYLNGKYYCKRALYLCEIAQHLKGIEDLVQEIKFSCNDGDNWKPFLEITPSGKLYNSVKFFIHPIPDKTTFRLSRFIPTRNNVRARWYFEEDSLDKDDEIPTPDYNAGVLRDLRSAENEEFLEKILNENVELRNGVILLKVWAKQRELNEGFGSFTGQMISFVIAYLLHIRKLNTSMSSYQIIRTFWNYFGNSDWAENGITLCEGSSDHQPSMSDYHQQYPLVFIDPSGFLNLCAGMAQLTFARCRDQSLLALRCLDTPDINSFQILFMTPAPFSRLCDQTIVFHNWKVLEKIVEEYSEKKTKLNFCGMIYPQVCNILLPILTKALGKRVQRIYIKQNCRRSWCLDKKPRTAALLNIGLVLDPDNCFSAIDKAEENGADDFRKFWKGRSELRRFKDGSITESVVWDAKSWQEKRMICREISKFILNSQLELVSNDFYYFGDELETILPSNRELVADSVTLAYEKLVKTLKNLKDLPLDIISVQGASPVFRSAELFPPSIPSKSERKQGCKKVEEKTSTCSLINPDAHVAPAWCASADVVIHLGSSNKWPRDVQAVRRIRAAFNIKISEALSESSAYKTHVYPDWVDVLTESCVFRLRIVYPGEIALMKKTTAADGMVLYRDNEDSLKLEKCAIHLPKITSALNGLHSQHSSYGMACCLAKRWVRSHLIDEFHISDEAIDLLVASVYVNAEPWNPPNQPQLAFLRFLALLAYTNWNLELILLNFNQVLSNDEKREIETNFNNLRASLPPIFIATPEERLRSIWTKDGPSSVVLLRLVNLAEKSLNLLEAQFSCRSSLDTKIVFQPVLTVFDVHIQLVSGFVPKRFQAVDAKNCTNNEDEVEIIPIMNFDPVQLYLQELRDSYSEWALFFYDSYGGLTIGVVWKPGSQQQREVKVSHLHGRTLDKTTNCLKFNMSGVLEGFHILGGGLIKAIKVKRDDQFVALHV